MSKQLNDLQVLTNNYWSHLLYNNAISRAIQPAIDETMFHGQTDFYTNVARGMTQQWYDNLGGENKVYTRDEQTGKELCRIMDSLFSTNMSYEECDNLLHDANNAKKKLIDHFVKNCGGECSVLGELVTKLKIVAELRMVLHPQAISEEKQIIANFKEKLEQHHQAIIKRRNANWSIFYNIASIILFPIALVRTFWSRGTRGTWDFTATDGQVLLDHLSHNLTP